MICTETEAKTKWCPHVRLGSEYSGIGALNRDFTGKNIQTNCIGSACMMWEWVDYDFEAALEYIGMSHRPNPLGHERAEQRLVDGWEEYESHDKAYRAFKRPTGERRRGTCGLIQRSGQ